MIPCSEVAVDVIVPWKITVAAQAIEFCTLTYFDTVSTITHQNILL
jgi:hypothetical protein